MNQLLYNIAYHAHCEIELKSGRSITLQNLDQGLAYSGLLEGIPDARFNDRLIKRAEEIARRYCTPNGNPHVLKPVRRDYMREPGDMKSEKAWFSRRVPEWLPMVRCIGSFLSIQPVRDKSAHASALVLVWFQGEYALPIQENVYRQLLEIDWATHASDFEF